MTLRPPVDPSPRPRRRTALVAATAALLAPLLLPAGASAAGHLPARGAARHGAGSGGVARIALSQRPSNWNVNSSDGSVFEANEVMSVLLPGAFITTPALRFALNRDLLLSARLVRRAPETVVYTIRPTARWSDGVPIDVRDFVYDWQTQNGKDPRYNANSITGYQDIRSVTGSRNGRTVTVVFARPFADWPSLFGSLLPAHYLLKLGRDRAATWNSGLTGTRIPRVSGGPFRVRSYTGGDLVLDRNPRWYGRQPHLARLVFRVVEPASQVAALRRHEVDVISPTATYDLVAAARRTSGVRVQTGLDSTWEHIDLNLNNRFLADRALRRAILVAADRRQMADRTQRQLRPSVALLGSRVLLPSQPGYRDSVTPRGLGTGDIAAGRRILADAGYTVVDGRLRTPKGEQVPSLRFVYTEGNQLRQTEGAVLRDDLAQLGIDLQLVTTPKLGRTLARRDFDLIVFAWVTSPSTLTGSLNLYRTRGDLNFNGSSDPVVDRELLAAARSLDPSAGLRHLDAADAQLSEDAVTLPLYQKTSFLATTSRLVGVVGNPSAGPTASVLGWRLTR